MDISRFLRFQLYVALCFCLYSVNVGLFITVGLHKRRCVSLSVCTFVSLLPFNCTTAGSQWVPQEVRGILSEV